MISRFSASAVSTTSLPPGTHGALPRQELDGRLHAGERVQHLVRELGGQLADRGQLLALDQPPPVLGERGVGLLELLDQRAHLVAERLEAGAAGRDLDARPLRRRLDLHLQLVDRLRDPARPQEPDEQAGDRARDAGADQHVGQPADAAARCRRASARRPGGAVLPNSRNRSRSRCVRAWLLSSIARASSTFPAS